MMATKQRQPAAAAQPDNQAPAPPPRQPTPVATLDYAGRFDDMVAALLSPPPPTATDDDDPDTQPAGCVSGSSG